MKPDTKTRYGTVSMWFHWGMAVLIGWQLLKFLDRVGEGEHWIGQTLVPWHVSIGTLLLILVVLRILWYVRQRGNRPLHDPATAGLVKAGHFLLYAGMVLMPLTGIATMIGNGYGLTAFGIELFPGGEEIAWLAAFGSLHSPTSWAVLLLVAGHTAIALLHHFVRRDDVLRRML